VGGALDKLAAEKTKEKEAPPVVAPVVPVVADDDAAKKAAEEAAAAEKAKADKAAEYFKDTPQLPQGASTKSHEAFASIKIKAAQDLSARDKQIDELKKQLAERDEKLKSPVPPELLKELEDSRAFRAKLDVDADPKFKSFDDSINKTRDFIYAQFRNIPGVTDATIEAVKKAGGPDKIMLDTFFKEVQDPALQRLVESKVADIKQKQYEKQQAVDAAKGDVQTYLKQREEELVNQGKAHFENTRTELAPILDSMDFLRELPAEDPKAKEHNAKIEGYTQEIVGALNDNSPKMRAVLIGATIRLFHERAVHAGVVTERDGLKKANAELTAQIDKIKSSATTRLRESAAPVDGKMPSADKSDVNFTERPQDALDRLAKQISEERSKAGK
jgi:hypothetical protein